MQLEVKLLSKKGFKDFALALTAYIAGGYKLRTRILEMLHLNGHYYLLSPLKISQFSFGL
ncbi:hypothetical protein MP638_002638, partial [Amoeboaphelidium occidentale]